MIIYRTWKKLPDGRVLYAKDYGLKAFRMDVDSEHHNAHEESSFDDEKHSSLQVGKQ